MYQIWALFLLPYTGHQSHHLLHSYSPALRTESRITTSLANEKTKPSHHTPLCSLVHHTQRTQQRSARTAITPQGDTFSVYTMHNCICTLQHLYFVLCCA